MIELLDLNHNGIPDVAEREDIDVGGLKTNFLDIHLIPGSPEAKAAWKQIEGAAKAHKMFMGKPLMPGAGQGEGDFNFLKARLMLHDGYNEDNASRIAGAIKKKLYGG